MSGWENGSALAPPNREPIRRLANDLSAEAKQSFAETKRSDGEANGALDQAKRSWTEANGSPPGRVFVFLPSRRAGERRPYESYG